MTKRLAKKIIRSLARGRFLNHSMGQIRRAANKHKGPLATLLRASFVLEDERRRQMAVWRQHLFLDTLPSLDDAYVGRFYPLICNAPGRHVLIDNLA